MASEEKRGFFDRMKRGLAKTRAKFSQGIKSVLTLGRRIDAETLEELMEALVASDIGPRAAQRIVDDLQAAYKERQLEDLDEVNEYLKEELKQQIRLWDTQVHMAEQGPTVILVAGINGSGKTTSIAKLAFFYKQQHKKVLLAAADTFRAAAVEQIGIWAERVDVEIVKQHTGSDPAAVAFDAADAALARGADVLIIDTAGRLHTKQNLMRELSKIERVVSRKIPGAPHEVLLVLDATTGQNAVSQALLFKEAINVTGLFLAKLDGTAKGGIVLGMRDLVDIPVKFVGLGEKAQDMEPFDPEAFVDALFA